MQQQPRVPSLPGVHITLEKLSEPLVLEQFLFILVVIGQLPHGLSDLDQFAAIAACLTAYMLYQQTKPGNRVAEWPVLDTERLGFIIKHVFFLKPFVILLQKVPVTNTLKKGKVLYAARPVTMACCACGSDDLVDRPSKHDNYFYSSTGPPCLGTLYFLECRICNSIHELDGYVDKRQIAQADRTPGSAKLAKRPYRVELQHKHWFQSTYNTIIDVKMLERFDVDLVFKACSFRAFTEGENHLNGTFSHT
jgi:hypothetical protein